MKKWDRLSNSADSSTKLVPWRGTRSNRIHRWITPKKNIFQVRMYLTATIHMQLKKINANIVYRDSWKERIIFLLVLANVQAPLGSSIINVYSNGFSPKWRRKSLAEPYTTTLRSSSVRFAKTSSQGSSEKGKIHMSWCRSANQKDNTWF